MKSIYQTNFNNQKVLVRVDFNVPLGPDKKVTDNSRIVAAKKTINKIINDGGTAVLMSHLGRPKGNDPELSFLLKAEIAFLEILFICFKRLLFVLAFM